MVIERFVAWLESAGFEDKCHAIADVIGTYQASRDDEEAQSACERLFGFFVADRDARVRQTLSQSLCELPSLPKALIWNLLQDEPAIAALMYAKSPAITERTLLGGVEEGGTIIQTAIAGRSGLSSNVILALVAKGSPDAIARVLENEEIVLGAVLKHDIAKVHGSDARIRALLLADDDLAPSTRQMLVRGLTDALTSFVADTKWTDIQRLKTVANDAANSVTLSVARQEGADMQAYITHLRVTAQLTPALVLRSICAGHGAFFEAALSSLSGMSIKRVQSIIDDGRRSAFKALYGRTNLPVKAFDVFCSAISVWQDLESQNEFTSATEAELYTRALSQIVDLAEADPSTDASLMAMLHRMLAECSRDSLRVEHHLKLLTAA